MKVPFGPASKVKKWQIYALNGNFAFAFIAYIEEETDEKDHLQLTAEQVSGIIDRYIEDQKLLERDLKKNPLGDGEEIGFMG